MSSLHTNPMGRPRISQVLPLLSRLSKTARNLLLLAAARDGRYAVETVSGRGARGGRISCGNRDSCALNLLVDLGLADITFRSTSSDANNGNTIRTHIRAFRILPAAEPYIFHLQNTQPPAK